MEERDMQYEALKHRSTMGWHLTAALLFGAALAGIEMVLMKSMTLAVAFMPIVAGLAHNYAERKRNDRQAPRPPQG